MIDRSVRRTAPLPPTNASCLNGKGDAPQSSPQMGKEHRELLHRLQTLDFSIYDTVLYLDAYPDSKDALAYYNKLMAERRALIEALSESHDFPLTAFDNKGEKWEWIDSPWPWEALAN